MRSYLTYVCEKCGKESRDSNEIKQCEANHLGLTIDEKFQYDGLKEIARRCGYVISTTKNERTDMEFDEAIENLIQFERTHGITTK